MDTQQKFSNDNTSLNGLISYYIQNHGSDGLGEIQAALKCLKAYGIITIEQFSRLPDNLLETVVGLSEHQTGAMRRTICMATSETIAEVPPDFNFQFAAMMTCGSSFSEILAASVHAEIAKLGLTESITDKLTTGMLAALGQNLLLQAGKPVIHTVVSSPAPV